MRKINKAMFIFIFVCSLPFTLLNFCFAGTIEDLGKIKCRDFIFIHKKIPRIYVGNEGPYIICVFPVIRWLIPRQSGW
jgi:hypothetical protein